MEEVEEQPAPAAGGVLTWPGRARGEQGNVREAVKEEEGTKGQQQQCLPARAELGLAAGGRTASASAGGGSRWSKGSGEPAGRQREAAGGAAEEINSSKWLSGSTLPGGAAAAGGGRGDGDPSLEAVGRVVLPAMGGGDARIGGKPSLGPHQVWAAAGASGGGRRWSGTPRNTRVRLPTEEGGGADRLEAAAARGHELTRARPELQQIAADGPDGAGSACGWRRLAGTVPGRSRRVVHPIPSGSRARRRKSHNLGQICPGWPHPARAAVAALRGGRDGGGRRR
ncbi:spidroin-1-like [Ananas comosus]|uniref:Spidroin-1-like n=1 Tax=Ananas comosus TaxID=4615 RepID=A0A6P5GFD4_ANACO|nr:spidroin-1-like [Ananas comosus]